MVNIPKVDSTQPASSKHPYDFPMYMPKRVGGMGQSYLNPIFQLISLNHPSVFLNLAISFSCNLIKVALNPKETFISSNLFQRLFHGTMSKVFLKSTKQHMRLVLLFWHSSTMMFHNKVVHCWMISSKSSLAFISFLWLFRHTLIFFSKIIPYNLDKRKLIIMVL